MRAARPHPRTLWHTGCKGAVDWPLNPSHPGSIRVRFRFHLGVNLQKTGGARSCKISNAPRGRGHNGDTMAEKRATPEQLAQEAAAWSQGTSSLAGWIDAPDAIPRHAESTAISIRMPNRMLGILREYARRRGIGYQVLIKQWLEDRIQQEIRLG